MRVNVYSTPTDCGDERVLLGWYDPERAVEAIDEDTRWDGNNWCGVTSGTTMGALATLYRTAGGRWVERQDRRRCRIAVTVQNPDTSRFLSDDEAREWLLINGRDEVVERYWGPVAEESGPDLGGRPYVGPAISVKIPEDLLAAMDAASEAQGIARAEWIRRACTAALDSAAAAR